jgi:phosphoenolpyruvate synthase/pyruvate phosphate dikinase
VWGLGKLAVKGSVMPDQIKVTRTMDPPLPRS